MKVYLQQCQEFVNLAFKNASKYGISNKINQSLLKIRQQLERVSIILNLLVIDSPDDYLKNQDNYFSVFWISNLIKIIFQTLYPTVQDLFLTLLQPILLK